MTSPPSVLVVGATGATGKLVVRQLLDQKIKVSVIVRSKERMVEAIGDHPHKDLLSILEAPSLQPQDLSDSDLKKQVEGVDMIVSCLGHNLSFQGIWGHPRRLVTDTVRRLTSTGATDKKFILMGSDGVAHANDTVRPWLERSIIFLLRHLVPPQADNEEAAAYVNGLPQDAIEWVVVRPTDLIDTDEPTPYTVYEKPPGSLFGSGEASRATVAKFMVDLIRDGSLWNKYKYQMPVLHNEKEGRIRSRLGE